MKFGCSTKAQKRPRKRGAFCICGLATKQLTVRDFRRIVVGIGNRRGFRNGADNNGFANIIIGLLAPIVTPMLPQSARLVGGGSFGGQGRFVLHRSTTTAPDRFFTLIFFDTARIPLDDISLTRVSLTYVSLARISLARVIPACLNLDIATLNISALVTAILRPIQMFDVWIVFSLKIAAIALVALMHGALLTVTLLLDA
jgi:hypothetical protein